MYPIQRAVQLVARLHGLARLIPMITTELNEKNSEPCASGCLDTVPLRPLVQFQGFPNLLKQSTGGSNFWKGTSYNATITSPVRSVAGNSTLTPSVNGRFIKINQWNKEHRFLRAYLDKDNDPYAEMDLDVEHAFLTEGLANNIDTWAAVLPKFKQFIGFK